MILKNGQHEEDTDPWVPQVEDINTDKSSIYLTSTQAIPINVASKKYNSYFSPPTSTDKFVGEQVILNSGRLLFNSKSDSILLSSFKTINLNSLESVNIDSPETIIKSGKVLLGDKYATEPVILGDKFLADFQDLLSKIISLSAALQTPIGSGPPYAINPSIPVPAVQVQQSAQKMIGQIAHYKSKISKSK
tara:strand:- start:789 stop:1361 length:573 start_codon:yes stop_codon:yes gene_type:complete